MRLDNRMVAILLVVGILASAASIGIYVNLSDQSQSSPSSSHKLSGTLIVNVVAPDYEDTTDGENSDETIE